MVLVCGCCLWLFLLVNVVSCCWWLLSGVVSVGCCWWLLLVVFSVIVVGCCCCWSLLLVFVCRDKIIIPDTLSLEIPNLFQTGILSLNYISFIFVMHHIGII